MKLFGTIVCFLVALNMRSNQTVFIYYLDSTSTVICSEQLSVEDKQPNPIFQLFRKKQKLNKKITAAALALSLIHI